MNEPKKNLFDKKIPTVDVIQENAFGIPTGTKIIIYGYNENRRDKFTHAQLKDFVLWFTKFGAVERCFGIENNKDVKLQLKGVDEGEYEDISFGHVFPEESASVNKLFANHMVDAPKWYCKKVIREKNLKNFPEIKFQAVFYVEGTKIKYRYNPMIKCSCTVKKQATENNR